MLFDSRMLVSSIFIAEPVGPNPPPAGGFPTWNPMIEITQAEVVKDMGIIGDRWFGVTDFKLEDGRIKTFPHKRQVSLFELETFIQLKKKFPALEAQALRRNILVTGMKLKEAESKNIIIGYVVLKLTGLCDSCEHIERTIGIEGISKAMRKYGGGIRAEVLQGGTINKGDLIQYD